MNHHFQEQLTPAPRVRQFGRPWHHSIRAVVREVSEATGIGSAAIQSLAQGHRIIAARHLAWLTLHCCGYRAADISRLVGFEESNINEALSAASAEQMSHAMRIAGGLADALPPAKNSRPIRTRLDRVPEVQATVQVAAQETGVDPRLIGRPFFAPPNGPLARARRLTAIALTKLDIDERSIAGFLHNDVRDLRKTLANAGERDIEAACELALVVMRQTDEADKALVSEHFERAREVKRAQKAGAQ
jgi:hypothetical protein